MAHFAALCAREEELRREGVRYVAGIDEAGRGPLAGDVYAAAVILPRGCFIAGLDDSKKLSPKSARRSMTKSAKRRSAGRSRRRAWRRLTS